MATVKPPMSPTSSRINFREVDWTAITSESSPLLPGKKKRPAPESTNQINSAKDDDQLITTTKGSWRSSKVFKVTIFISLWFAYLFISAAYSVIAPFFPQEASNKGVSIFIVGLIIGCSPICVTVCAPLFGLLSPQLGVRFLMIAGITLVGGCFILLAFMIDMPTSIEFIVFSCLLRTVEGIGSAAYFTASFTVVANLFPSNLGFVMGLMELASGFGFVLGPPIGGLLYSLGGFRLPFLVTGGLTLLFAPIFLILLPKMEAQKQTISVKTLLKLITNMPFFVIVLGNIVIIAALGFFTPTLSPFLINTFHLNEVQVGLVFLSGPGVYLVLSLVIGALTDRLGPRGFMSFGALVTASAYFFIGPAEFITPHSYLWLTIVSFSVMGVGIACGLIPVFPAMAQIAKKVDPECSPEMINGVISGVISSTMSFGEFLGPLLGGALTQILDFKMAAVVFGELVLAEGILLSGIFLIDLLLSRR